MCFFFNDTATTEIYTLSLHDALPISRPPAEVLAEAHWLAEQGVRELFLVSENTSSYGKDLGDIRLLRSEEHTSELQSRQYLVCRLLLEKKQKHPETIHTT